MKKIMIIAGAACAIVAATVAVAQTNSAQSGQTTPQTDRNMPAASTMSSPSSGQSSSMDSGQMDSSTAYGATTGSMANGQASGARTSDGSASQWAGERG